MGYWHGGGGWWFLLFPLFWLFWIVLFFVVLGFVFRRRRWGRPPWAGNGWGHAGAHPGAQSGEQVLAERYARGEIDEAEYARRLSVLRQHQPPAGQPPQSGRP